MPVSDAIPDAVPPGLISPTNQCICPDQQRSIWDILWSSFATIFACTWVTVHPNIPPSGEKWWKIGLRRMELMFWALIAPEFIILWAMKQWYAAHAMLGKYGPGWTKTHGYFIQMGGFTLYEGGKPERVLIPREMDCLLKAGQIDLPQITEEEIWDRSKSDGLSKILVVGQTSWFVTQCIARRAQGLILTELELVTAAFAALNGVMYFLWWNKPLDIRCSVAIHLLDKANQPFEFESTEKSSFSIQRPMLSMMETFAVSVSGFWKSVRNAIHHTQLKAAGKLVTMVIILPWTTFRLFILRLSDIYRPEEVLEVEGSVSTVSTFYASSRYIGGAANELLMELATSVIAVLFGGIHCAAWFFSFPSRAELMIWRISSAIISVVPLGMLYGFVAGFCYQKATPGSLLENLFEILILPVLFPMFCLPIYVIARFLLLGEAFAALRYLPPEALAVVNWLLLLPHI